MKDKHIETIDNNEQFEAVERKVSLNNNDTPELNIPKNIIGKISELFVKRFDLTIMIIGLLVILGITSYVFLPKESLPEIVFPSLTIQTVYPGANPTDVETLVTKPIESRVSSLEDVTEVSSSSNYGFSFISVTFDESVDIDRKKAEMESALNEVSLPAAALKSTVSTFNTSQIPLISLSLTGDYSLVDLTKYAKILASEIEKQSGVDQVLLFGDTTREIQINMNEEKTAELGITMDTVSTALKGDNISFPIGEISENSTNYNLRIDERITTAETLGDVLIPTRQGTFVKLSEIADVEDTNKEITQFNQSYTQDSGLNNSVFVSVIRKNRSDVLGTSEGVKGIVDKTVGTLIPSDLSVVISRDTAVQVEEDLSNIQSNALSGLLVVILVLFMFIGFRESIIVSVTIPLTLFATLGILSFFNITLNTFAILGLIVSLGLLVDNAIIVMENMDRLHKKGIDAKSSAIFGTNQVGFPIASATLTTVAAFFPLAILPGIIGAFINTIPRTIIITLLASLIIAIVITPSVYAFVYRKVKVQENELPKAVQWIVKVVKLAFVGALSVIAFYGESVWIGIPIIGTLFFLIAIGIKEFASKGKSLENNGFSLAFQRGIINITKSRLKMSLIILLSLGILASSFMLIVNGNIKIAFFPQTEPRSVKITVDTPAGSSLDTTTDVVGRVQDILMTLEDVKQFNATIGGNEVDLGVINIDLADNENNGFTQLDTIKEAVQTIDGATITFESQGAGGPPVGKPIEVQIIGDDLIANKALSSVFSEKLSTIEGTYNVESSIKEGGKELLFNVNIDKAKEAGINTTYLAFFLKKQLDGEIATSFTENNETVDIRVMPNTTSLDELKNLEVFAPTGIPVKLSDLVNITESTGVSGIVRNDGKRIITLTADLEKGFNASEAVESFKASVADLELPQGTSISYGGEAAGISENFGNLFRSMILAIFLVFIILAIQFGSVKQPFAIIMTIPMAFIGVLYGLWITGNEFGFYAFMALISLVGIAVNDAIVLIDYMNYLRKEGYGFFEAIGEATRSRLTAVLATTLTTVGGILPLAFKSAYYAQFAYGLAFGLLVTAFMTLVLIPIFYSLLEGKEARKELKVLRKNQKSKDKDQDKDTEDTMRDPVPAYVE